MIKSDNHNLSLAQGELQQLSQSSGLPSAFQCRLVEAASQSAKGIDAELSRLMEELLNRVYSMRHSSPNRSKNLSGQISAMEADGIIPDHVLIAVRTAVSLRNHYAHPLDKNGHQREYPGVLATIQVKAFEILLTWLMESSWGHNLIVSIYPSPSTNADAVERQLLRKLEQEMQTSPICSSSYAEKAALAESKEAVTVRGCNWNLPEDVDLPYQISGTLPDDTFRRITVATASIQPSVIGTLNVMEDMVNGIDLRLYSHGVELLEYELQREDPADIIMTVDGAMAISANSAKMEYSRVLPIHNEFQWVLCPSFEGRPRLNAVHFVPRSTGEIQYWNYRRKGILPQTYHHVNVSSMMQSMEHAEANQGFIVWEPLADVAVERGIASKVPGVPRFTNWICMYVYRGRQDIVDYAPVFVTCFRKAWNKCVSESERVAHRLAKDREYVATFEQHLFPLRNIEGEQPH